MYRKHRSIFHNHAKYIHNDILKHFRLCILQYAERVCEVDDLAKYIPTPLTKKNEYDQSDRNVRDK